MANTITNEIRIGNNQNRPSYRWNNEKIVLNSLRGVFTVDVLGNELSVDQFNATVRWNVDAPLVYAPVGKDGYKDRNGKVYLLRKPTGYGQKFLTDIPPSTAVYWYVGGSVYAKGYFKSVERIARHLYKITCMSGIGLLNAKTHVGGLYTGQTVTALLSSIIGSTFPYTVAEDVGSVTVYGHLKYTNARANLHELLFAIGAVLTKDANGNYQVVFLSNTMTNVPTSRVALGGKTEYVTPADSVEVTEHSFFALNSDEVVQLFDNSNGAAVSNQLVIFDNPMHDLTVTGNLTISESSVNHAVVSGVGSLTGKQFTHNAMIIKQGSTSNNVKRVTSNELISFANSYYVAKRVYSYFASTKTLNAKILLEDEKPGQLLALRDSFGDPTNAYLSQMDVSVTTVKLAQCKLIAGFQPGANGNNFTHRALITANATWTVPSGVTRIRIVLIGGAQGGQGGYDGADGLDSTTTPGLSFYINDPDNIQYYNYRGYRYENGEQPAALGGAGGSAGAKAAFLVSDKVVSAGNTIAIVVGVGGNGGARNGGEGSAGTPTTASGTAIGTLSSDDGVATYEGYNDPVSGITYAIDGVDGTKGGDGGRPDAYGADGSDGGNGESAQTWSGGQGGAGVSGTFIDPVTLRPKGVTYTASGGGGGGAAVGNNGGAGTSGSYYTTQSPGDVPYTIYNTQGGNGGNGGNAVAPNQPAIYGQGGAGGHGGGGGGNAAGTRQDTTVTFDFATEKIYPGTKGLGGQGSAGSQGGNGCAIIYY